MNHNFSIRHVPVDTKCVKDIPLWSCFGRKVPDHNKTKIGRARFLAFLGPAMPDIHLTSGNIGKLI